VRRCYARDVATETVARRIGALLDHDGLRLET
jgi:hypothetical protein